MDWPIPPGYRIEESDERVAGMKPLRSFYGPLAATRARRFTRAYPPMIPSYRLMAERLGPFRWQVVALQNRLVPIPKPPEPARLLWFKCASCDRMTVSGLCGCPDLTTTERTTDG